MADLPALAGHLYRFAEVIGIGNRARSRAGRDRG